MDAPAISDRVGTVGLLRFGCVERLHQAALAAGGVILVNNTLFGGLIEAADGLQDGGFIGFAGFEANARIANCGTGGATESAVAQAALFVLTIALDL